MRFAIITIFLFSCFITNAQQADSLRIDSIRVRFCDNYAVTGWGINKITDFPNLPVIIDTVIKPGNISFRPISNSISSMKISGLKTIEIRTVVTVYYLHKTVQIGVHSRNWDAFIIGDEDKRVYKNPELKKILTKLYHSSYKGR